MKHLIIGPTVKAAKDYIIEQSLNPAQCKIVTRPEHVEGYSTHTQPITITILPRAYEALEWRAIRDGVIRSFFI